MSSTAAPTSAKPADPNSVLQIFKNMSYGPAPEADNVAQTWLEDHQRSFGHFINNKWHKPEGRKTYQAKNPSTGAVLASTMQGTEEDVNLAVTAANEAAKSWAALPGHVRARHIYSIARHVQKHLRLFSVIESLDNGKCFRETRDCDIPLVVRHLYHHAGWAQLIDDEFHGKWKPVGVVGAIVPWNFPLMLMTWKVCPALAMGNTVVLKPATYTRLSALLFAEICAEAGLPPGVFNVITGDGAMGSLLAGHPDVDKVAFTGSTEVGQKLRRLIAGSGKKLSLELGGKSPMVVYDSADLDSATEGVMDAIFFNQGQVCCAGSRLLVHESIHDKLVEKIKRRLNTFRVGDALDKTVEMGAIVDESQWKSVEEYVQSARQEGASVFQAWNSLPPAARPTPEEIASGSFKPKGTGLFYPPTLITNVQTVSKVVQEEIFGPVLVVLTFRTAKESIALANNTRYGLGASVWTENVSLGLEACMSIKAGTVWFNCHNIFDAAAGFGGYKQSGYGRDGGKEGLIEYIKPAWEENYRGGGACKGLKTDLAKFGATQHQGIPTIQNNAASMVSKATVAGSTGTFDVPSIDKTYKLFYGGKQQRPDAPYSRPIRNPLSGAVIGHVGDANRKDVRNAVEAAHGAAPGWGKRAAYNRSQILYYLAENLEERRAEFAAKLSAMTGDAEAKSLREVDLSIQRLFYWAAYADKYGGEVQETTLYGATVKIHEPVGVIGITCPDEYPLLAFVSLLAPAIVRSNTAIIIPSERFPLAALEFYQVLDTSDVPPGVVNILTGERDHITKYLAEHQDVDAAWYFGSAEGSKFVETAAAENLKRTWVSFGRSRAWDDNDQGQGLEFLYHATQVKNIWIPMGEIFAN